MIAEAWTGGRFWRLRLAARVRGRSDGRLVTVGSARQLVGQCWGSVRGRGVGQRTDGRRGLLFGRYDSETLGTLSPLLRRPSELFGSLTRLLRNFKARQAAATRGRAECMQASSGNGVPPIDSGSVGARKFQALFNGVSVYYTASWHCSLLAARMRPAFGGLRGSAHARGRCQPLGVIARAKHVACTRAK